MHKPKLIKLFLLLLVLGSLWPAACTKRYEEDPFTMHFVRMRKRITGEWHMKKILIDGADYTNLIYNDSTPLYSIYVFSSYRRTLHVGDMILKTHDSNYSTNYKDVAFAFIGKKGNEGLDKIYFMQHPINNYSFGPINNFFPLSSQMGNPLYGTYLQWDIKKLTKKEMQLLIDYNNQKYEIYFDKK
ncbi:MAG: hypothetical protein HUU48_07695 [Flavobacteriales bacterium]|nr:hypothetical protein [Flavobacteriales bacterium]